MINKMAIPLILLATFCFAIQDAVIKILSNSGSLWQLMLLRALIVVTILFLLSKSFYKSSSILPNGWFWPILRGIFMSCAYTFFYCSLPFVSLSKAATCFFTAPIFICIFSSIILKETIGWRRVSAVLIGFIGVLVIIRPGTENVNLILILPLLAGVCYALAQIITRGFCQRQSSFSLTFSHNILYALLGFLMVSVLALLPFPEELLTINPFLFTGWFPLTNEILLLIGATSLTHIVALTATIRAYQTAETSFVAPLEYFYLIFVALVDYALWKVIPEFSVVIGIVLIMVSGIIISLREDIKKRKFNDREVKAQY